MKRVGFISNFETRDLTDDSFVSVVSMQDEMYLEGVITCKKISQYCDYCCHNDNRGGTWSTWSTALALAPNENSTKRSFKK
jgi:hypothetical protein